MRADEFLIRYSVLLKNSSKAPPSWEPQEVARRLEQNLYYSADSKAAYIDVTTLRNRLQAVMNRSRKQTAAVAATTTASTVKKEPNSILDEIDREAQQQEKRPASASSSVLLNQSSSGGSKHQKVVVLQQRLMLLKHARLCKNPEGACMTPHCMTFRNILAHIAECKQENCTVSGCMMAKQLLSHYKMCRNFSCQLCNSIRKPMDKGQQTEVLRRQQERLCLLRHASICDKEKSETCTLTYCPEMKALWRHICSCTNRQCQFNHCVSSRYVLTHFKECRNLSCEVCAPVRKAIKISENVDSSNVAAAAADDDDDTLAGGGRKRSAQAAKLDDPAILAANKKQMQAKLEERLAARSQKDITYLESLSAEQLDAHIQSLRYNFMGHFGPGQLRTYLSPLLKKLMDHPFGWVFSSPVDPNALNIPDYFEIIKCPMDLGTIKKRLEGSSYYISIDAVAADVCLTFENCIAYNDSDNEFHILARDLLATFQKDMEVLRKQIDIDLERRLTERREEMCQLCAGDSYKFAPSMLFCNGPCRGRIRRHTHYYSNAKNEFHWCSSCFKDMKDNVPITVGTKTVEKSELKKQKNSDVVEEPWVECDCCKKWYHQICALFNERNNAITGEEDPFLCPACVLQMRQSGRLKPSEEGLNAKRLPHSRLSQYLENRVVKAMRLAADDEEKRIGKKMNMTGLDANGIAVREVLSVEKKVVVKDRMKKIFQEAQQQIEFTYRSRCICFFQKIDGVDVLLFTLYVQEYGDKVPEPNRRRIYISYLDSVNFFQPKKFRTLMHQEIIIGCLQDAKKRGYRTAHIWSCPPLKGDDYIFFCKPENQKIPKAARLRQWYMKLLTRAQEEQVLYKVSNLYVEYYQKMKPATALPYFDGDYWPGLAEELLKQIEEKSTGSSAAASESNATEVKKKKKKKKKTKGANGSTTTTIEPIEEEKQNPDRLMQKFKPILQPQKDDFFVIELHPICCECSVPISDDSVWCCEPLEPTNGDVNTSSVSKRPITTRNEGKIPQVASSNSNALPAEPKMKKTKKQFQQSYYCTACYESKKDEIGDSCRMTAFPFDNSFSTDTDPLMPCEIFDTRESFLTYCQSNHCQFDQLRRAKHSSMMILYHLFNQGTTGFSYSCSVCETKLERGNRWNCSLCAGFNLCDDCKVKTKHEHSLYPITCVPVKTKKSDSRNAKPQRKQIDPVLLKLIEHASGCVNPTCQPNCLRMRELLKHGATCKAKISGKCQTCRRVLGLLKFHAQLCRKDVCSVPRCKDIRDHLARARQAPADRRQTNLIASASR